MKIELLRAMDKVMDLDHQQTKDHNKDLERIWTEINDALNKDEQSEYLFPKIDKYRVVVQRR